ncbi:MAG TPA: hypothetical protein VD735_05515 [Candidatus Saccharimonadales bacterium]|nr:hypothetical protein [Candidatus Saccharimonadales bacterium]
MDLTERYVYAVTRRLPQAQREDVANELRATIEDMATDHAKGEEPKTADITAVLKTLGDPDILAHRYNTTKQYLIGPRWYDAWLQTLRMILVIVLPIVGTLSALVSLADESNKVIESLIGAVGHAIAVGMQIFFWVTAVFVVMERSGAKPREIYGQPAGAWSPESLPAVPQPRQISRADAIGGMVTTGVGVLLLAGSNLLFRSRGDGESIPIFHPDLWQAWIPALLLLALLSFGIEAWKYKVGAWTKGIVGSTIALSLAWIAFIMALATTQELVNPAFMELLQNTATDYKPQEVVDWAIVITTGIAVGSCLWGIIDAIRRYRSSN